MSSRWLRILTLAMIATPVTIPAARMSSQTVADVAPQLPRFSTESELLVLHHVFSVLLRWRCTPSLCRAGTADCARVIVLM